MYLAHFSLDQEPFSIAPDPAFLFLSDVHNEALAHLTYGFTHGGFVLVTGEVGTGKTTLLRNLLHRTPPELDVAFILNPRLTVRELLESVCDEIGIRYDNTKTTSVKQYIDVLNRHVLQSRRDGRSSVLIIDEAQNLSPAVLEQIRLLTNLETNDKKLLRIILLGQPELAAMLAQTELRQLAQRITARYHLSSLSRAEAHAYVKHRLHLAGGHPGIFSSRAMNTLYALAQGTPRLINVIADRAMLGAYVEGVHVVTPKLVKTGAREVLGAPPRRRATLWWLASATAVLIALISSLWVYLGNQPGTALAPTAALDHVAPPAVVVQTPPLQRPAPTERVMAEPDRTTAAPTQPSIIVEAIVEPIPSPITVVPVARPSVATVTAAEPTDPSAFGAQKGALLLPIEDSVPAANVVRPPGGTFVNHRRAYQAVFAAWGVDYPLESPRIPCDFAPLAGLQCLRKEGSWSELIALNKPVVLELWDTGSNPYFGALVAGNGDLFRLSLGTRDEIIRPQDLRNHWLGSYVVLWQTPPEYAGSQREGDMHPTVEWLHAALAQIDPGSDLGDPEPVFTPALHRSLLAFQRREGLLADGVAGPMTWIRLSDRINSPSPALITR